jgi:cbb3-type cytochrome oxidase subunit 1
MIGLVMFGTTLLLLMVGFPVAFTFAGVAVIFGFGGSALIATAFYSVQRTCHVRLFAPKLAWVVTICNIATTIINAP